jgi:outer membrane protein TolC
MRYAPSVLALLVGACTVGPDYKAPTPPAVVDWRDRSARPGGAASTISANTDPDPQWWNAFRDPVLSGLIGQAIAGNLDLQQAVLRVVEARQNVITARAAGLPSLNG